MTLRRRRPSHAARLHNWPLGAFSQLIDATHSCNGVWLDVHTSPSEEPFFVVRDRGQGLSDAQLRDRTAVRTSVTEWLKGDAYACPWQAAVFRLGADVTILSRTRDACYVALLSRERVADLRHPESQPPNIVMQWHKSTTVRNRLVAEICTYSPWPSTSHISQLFDSMSPTGTLVAISSLKRDLQQAELELDLATDRYDIRLSALAHKDHNQFVSSIRLSHSLRSYLEMLYLNPTFRIYLRQRIVRERRLSASMFGRQDFVYNYTPTTESHSTSAPAPKSLVFRLGFDHSAHENEYGMLLYYKQRLVKPYLKLGFQIQPRNQIRVVAIVEADHLAPTPNMQSFEEDDAYQDLIFALGQALKLFWTQYGSMANAYRTHCNDPMLKWVRCDVCARWRQLAPGIPHPSDTSCVQWTCGMNTGATDACNQPDDACRQQVPVRVLEKRPISPISPPKECRKRAHSSTSPLGTPLKRSRHSAPLEANLVEVERGQHDAILGTMSPIPNLQSPIGLDSFTPHIVASDGGELRTDPFSLNESDSPLSNSTSSPGNMLEKAARAKPLPSTVRHEDSELRALEAPMLPSMNAKHPGANHVRWRGEENISKACDVEKGSPAANTSPQEPRPSSQLSAASPPRHQGNKATIASTEGPNVYRASQKLPESRDKSSDEEETNHAVVSESRLRVRNATTLHPTRPEVARQGKPVSVPLVREVVVHHSAQFVDINNRNSTVKVYPETRQYVPNEMLPTSSEGDVPVDSEHPPPYENQPDANASVAVVGFGKQCTVKVSGHADSNPQPQSTSKIETNRTKTPKERNNEEEAIKLLLNLRSRESDGQPGVGRALTGVDPDRSYEANVAAELGAVPRAQNDLQAHIEHCRQANRDIPDPFGDKSKPVTPAHELLQTPTKAVQDTPQRVLPAHLASMPGMPSPNTANPFLDLTVEDVLQASPLNAIDISKDFLDLGDIDAGLKTPSQLKRIPRRATPQNSACNMKRGQLHHSARISSEAPPLEAAAGLGPSNNQKNQCCPEDRVVFDVENPRHQRHHCSIGEGTSNPNIGPTGGQHVCCGDRIEAKQPPSGNPIHHCGRDVEVKDFGARERVPSETMRVSEISSMIPWSEIAATAAAAGAAAAAAAARDASKPNQPNTPERHSLAESAKLRASQEEVEKLKKELQDQKQLSDTFKEKIQELICELAPTLAGKVTKLLKNPNEIDVSQLSRDVLKNITAKAREEAGMEQLQAIESCRASERIACSSLERLRGLVRTFLEEAVGLTTQVEQDKPVDKHFEEYLNALDVFPP